MFETPRTHTQSGIAKGKILVALVLVGVLATVGVIAFGGDGAAPTASEPEQAQAAPAQAEQAVKIRVQRVVPAPLKDVLTLPGQTEPRHDLTLSAERGGRVEWVGPKEGDTVDKGQVIAKIDVEALLAELRRAEANYELAKKQADRRQSLLDRKVVSREELDKAETELAVAKSTLNEARVNYRQGVVRAPIGGVINDLHVDPGEYVQAGDPVADLVDVSTLRITVNVPEMDVRYLKKGDTAHVQVDAYPERTWTGKIDFVSFKADEGTKTFLTRVVVDNADGAIRPGMLSRISLVRREIPEAITAPLFALIDKGGERYVYVEEDGVARARIVQLGVIAGERIQITSGLAPGDNLIVSGQAEVEDGMRVVQ